VELSDDTDAGDAQELVVRYSRQQLELLDRIAFRVGWIMWLLILIMVFGVTVTFVGVVRH
jgi:hypothetical protein